MYQPDTSTISQRDINEIRTFEIVREYTKIPIPKLIYQGDGQVMIWVFLYIETNNVFERIRGITIFEGPIRDRISPRQREGIRLQVQDYIEELARVPTVFGGVRSLRVSEK